MVDGVESGRNVLSGKMTIRETTFHSTLGIKFSKTGFLQLVDSDSQPLI